MEWVFFGVGGVSFVLWGCLYRRGFRRDGERGDGVFVGFFDEFYFRGFL